MRKGGGKNKGSAFEREVAKRLSLWWTDDEREDVFARSISSGAFATTRAKSSKGTFGQYGDLQAIDPIGQPLIDLCVIEIKIGYKKWGLLELVDGLGEKHTVHAFLDQLERSRQDAGAPYGMLIAKRDFHQPIIFLSHDFILHARDYSKWCTGIPYIIFTCMGLEWYVVRFSDFPRWITPEVIQEMRKDKK